MRTGILLLVLVVCMAGCALSAAAIPADKAAAPHASMADPRLWDFGTVNEGEVVSHEFRLANDSGAPLVIKDTGTSCGCTVSEIGKKLLKPGESTILSVKFDSKGYAGPTQQFVYVNTGSPDTPVIKFVVKADVQPSKK